jgi:hypothetical protein
MEMIEATLHAISPSQFSATVPAASGKLRFEFVPLNKFEEAIEPSSISLRNVTELR